MSRPEMKLHWSPRSPFVRKVMIALHETGLPDRVELVRNPVAIDRPNAAVMADNPLGKIPTLVLADGTALYDSRVICEYLDGFHDGPNLFPPAGPARIAALRRQALADGLLDVLLPWRYWHARQGLDPLDDGDPYQRACALKAVAALDRLELEATDAVPDTLDIGDIAIGCLLSYLDFRWPVLSWREGRDRLAAWHRAFEARPSVLATRIVDDAAPAEEASR